MSFSTGLIPVIIAGGGPSGAATALSLTSRGIDCLVAEAEQTLKFKAGETVPPVSLPLLQKLGIDRLLDEPAHLHCYGNKLVWGDPEPYERTFLLNRYSHGWHVDRAHFELQLKGHAIGCGAQWLSGWRVTNCNEEDGGWKVLLTNNDGHTKDVFCDFIVDATGRASRIARNMGVARSKLDNLAGITMCFDTKDTDHPSYTFIEATQQGWWYAAPLSRHRLITTFFTDTDILDPCMKQASHYLDAIRTTSMVNGLINADKAGDPPAIYTASTSWLTERYGKGWLAVGDAAVAYDPVSSYGITSALESGYYAGHAIADVLAGNDDALTAYDWVLNNAFKIYRDMYDDQYGQEQRWATESFWKRRCKG